MILLGIWMTFLLWIQTALSKDSQSKYPNLHFLNRFYIKMIIFAELCGYLAARETSFSSTLARIRKKIKFTSGFHTWAARRMRVDLNTCLS
jgi:hypothetical protein